MIGRVVYSLAFCKRATADRAIEQAVQLIANIDGSFGSFARDSLGIVAAKRGMCYGSLIYTLVDGNKYNAALGSGISIEPGAAAVHDLL